ncbi:hypothetical protein HUJ04_000406 [Dendroctonus ponderosae]|nr:hypothetical protein HUJ04_000406 [Dendroctonus ponderosae]
MIELKDPSAPVPNHTMGKLFEKLLKRRLEEIIDKRPIIQDTRMASGKEEARWTRSVGRSESVQLGTVGQDKGRHGRKRDRPVPHQHPMLLLIIDPEGSVFDMTCGTRQGSTLGPTLWNIFYEDILKENLEDGVSITGNTHQYADDIALVVKANNLESLQGKASYNMWLLNHKLSDMGTKIAPEKKQIVLVAGRRKIRTAEMSIEGEIIASQDAAKYLGVYMDRNLR